MITFNKKRKKRKWAGVQFEIDWKKKFGGKHNFLNLYKNVIFPGFTCKQPDAMSTEL